MLGKWWGNTLIRTSKNYKSILKRLMIAVEVILIVAVIVFLLPKNPVHSKLPTDYFRDRYHLPYLDTNRYTILTYEEDIFQSFIILKVYDKNKIENFINDINQDELVVEEKVFNDFTPALNLIVDYSINDIPKIDLIPFDLNCDCFRYFTLNYGQIDGGYLYIIFIYEDLIIIDYYSR